MRALRDHFARVMVVDQQIEERGVVDWLRLCSALDAIEDCDLAINAYLAKSTVGHDEGHLYLCIYGLTQALVTQQHAVRDLCEALGLEDHFKNFPVLNEIRIVRAVSTGHPSARLSSIVRATMHHRGFELLQQHPDGSCESRIVDLNDMIRQQRKALGRVLALVVEAVVPPAEGAEA